MTDIVLPDGITSRLGSGDLPMVRVQTPSATAEVYLQGAHVTAWAPAGSEPVLWVSRQATFAPGRAIRGGVPICAPWFGPGRGGEKEPMHGFFRFVPWRLVSAVRSEDSARLTFELSGADCAQTARDGDYPTDFLAVYQVDVGAELQLGLTIHSTHESLDVEEALHSYFAVGDVRQAVIEGLDAAAYYDKVTAQNQTQSGVVRFTSETDRVYESSGSVTIVDPLLRRRITVGKSESANTVVWNPWADKARAMSDFGDQEWSAMVCVEAANVLGNSLQVPADGLHTITTRIGVAAL